MGREIRNVPPDWKHPIDEDGRFQPLHKWTYLEALKDHFIDELPWYLWPSKNWKHFKEWLTGFPDHNYYRPRWRNGEATHYQIYENVTEGTPVSPVFASLDDLIGWLMDNENVSRKAAERFAKEKYVPSMAFIHGALYMNYHINDAPFTNEKGE